MFYTYKNKLIALIFVLITTGCGYKQSNTQIRDVAFLKFTKSKLYEYTVHVNDNYVFELDKCKTQKDVPCEDSTVNNKYQVSSGNINIKVYNSNKVLILEKEIYLGSSNTVEIDLP